MNDAEYIQAYLDGTLKADEEAAFKERLEADKDFRKGYEEARAMENILLDVQDYSFVKQAASMARKEVEANEKAPGSSNTLRWYLGIAASLLVLVAALFFILKSPPPIEPCTLFNKKPEIDLLSASKGAESPFVSVIGEAREAYILKDYSTVIQLLDSIPTSQQLYPLAMLMKGNAHMGLCQSADAIPFLIAASSDPKVAERAQWFLALAYIGNGQQAAARPILERYAAGNYRKAEAKDLLKRLR
ncbi:MAG: hypothetical protein AB8F95_11430 [Bacteroidia bacterium]